MKQILLILIVIIPHFIRGQKIEYPITEKQEVVDTFFNTPVVDNYRWLESTNDQRLNEWVELQNKLTNKEIFKGAVKYSSYVALDKYSYTIYSNPTKKRDYYFTLLYLNDVGSPSLCYQKSMRDNPSILVDPNLISLKDNIRIKGYSVSKDSKLLAYQFSRNGSDWCEIKVINLNTEIHLKDHLTHIKFSNIAWKDDGFYYSTFPDQGIGKTSGQGIYYHKIGTEQIDDKLIFKRENNPNAFFSVETTSDERFLILNENDEKNGFSNIFYTDFNDSIPALRPLIMKLKPDEHLNILDNKDSILIASTFKSKNNGMIVEINPKNPKKWKTLIPEYNTSLLLNIRLFQDKIIALYQTNRKQQIIFFNYAGDVLHALDLPFGYSASGFSGEKEDKKILFSYSGYTQPKIVYILDIESFEMNPLRATTVNFDYTQFESKELEYESFDGTKVPLFIIYQKGINLTNNNPALLSAYGGFGSIETPGFEPGIVHFLKNGGIYAFANIRGGGDKGKEWALQGRGKQKQNSFNDFIAAAEFLIKNNYTSADRLAITGGSYGGLVVSVAMTQRPELFKVVVPIVAPTDMIRHENFTIGHYHSDEYGDLNDSTDFKNILSYSPYHNIKENVNYPATLIMTSDNDDRVPPLHSYKFAAKLQNRSVQTNPILLRIEKDAGHSGASKGFRSILQEQADMYDFILYFLLNK